MEQTLKDHGAQRVAPGKVLGRSVLEDQDDVSDPGIVCFYLHAVALEEKPDMILMGKQAIDDDNSQIGPRLAARLGVPQATCASRIEVSGDHRRARVTREVDAGQETLDISLPAVITTDLRLNEPRYVALPAILKARAKSLKRIPGAELGAKPGIKIRIVERHAPPARKLGRRVANVPELVAALRNEAKVI